MAAPLSNRPATINPASAFRFMCVLFLLFALFYLERIHSVLFTRSDQTNLNRSPPDRLHFVYAFRFQGLLPGPKQQCGELRQVAPPDQESMVARGFRVCVRHPFGRQHFVQLSALPENEIVLAAAQP